MKPFPAREKLTARQRKFVEEYIVTLNATKAAKAAGYSPHTATEQGSRLLTLVKVQTAIAEAQKASSERAEVDADYVLQRLQIESQRCGPGNAHSARVRALELLGKHLGLFVESQQRQGC